MKISTLTVTVIIPVFNGGAKFRASLDSVRKADPPPDEIIVVGDGDTDGSSQYAEAAGVRVYRFPSPGGPGRARNLGASQAQSDILFFVDADVTIPPNAVSHVQMIFQDTPSVDAIIGSYDEEPGEPDFLSQYKNLFHHFVHQNGQREASTFWGACGAIRRTSFQAVHGFDESYRRPSIEDIELGYRLRRGGKRILLVPSLQVKHLKRWTWRSLLIADFRDRAVPWTRLILRERMLQNDLNISISQRVSVAMVFTALAATLIAWQWPLALLITGGCAIAVTLLNLPLYRFFYRLRGWWFAVKSIPCHWLYFFYSGLAFALGALLHALNRTRSSWKCLSPVAWN
ncbi:MAG: glycosyltransferase [Nitrospira sp. CR1.3]|nr:glycosyltransferase [Nitrospira sp. CR1.3]